LAGHFDAVVIDGEAGIEQVNRRVMERITDLVLVSDPSARGLRVADTIGQMAKSIPPRHRNLLIVNRTNDPVEIAVLSIPPTPSLSGWVGEDPFLRQCDIQGQSLLDLPFSPTSEAVMNFLPRLLQEER